MKILLLISVLAFSSPSYGYLHQPTVLYSDVTCTTPLTTLPETYFVTVLSYDGVYKVSYKDISGYLNEVDIVDYEPVTKYASSSFATRNDGNPVKLRESPHSSAAVLTYIPDGGSGYYYGDSYGDALIEEVGTLWRYVSYNDGTAVMRGYVYSAQVSVSEIQPNTIEKVQNKDVAEIPAPSSSVDYILIICLTVPSVLIMYLVFGGGERKRN